jgi:DNA-binding PadR family transcriptional regulator
MHRSIHQENVSMHAATTRFDPRMLGVLFMGGRHHHHRGRHHGRGFWPGGPMGFGGPPGRGPRRRRGDVRAALLALLADEPRNGYQLMQEIENRSEGVWRPSPGSVYPALQQLEDEQLIRSEETDGRRLYHLTDAGRAFVADRPDDQPAPWETFADTLTDQHAETGALMRDVGMAFVQVLHAGSEAQVAEAGKVLAETRRSLYRILADGDPEPETEEPE